jgi:hypothetical protein
MPDIDTNLTVDVTGNTAAIATDYSTTGITNSHVQIVKLAWGPANTTSRVSTSAPLPVDIRTVTATLGITGSVSGIGNFRMLNGLSGSTTLPIIVSGTTSSVYAPVQVNGYVQGVTNGVRLGVTGSVSVLGNLNVQGVTNGVEIGITGGRRLNSTTDSVTVSGTVGVTGGRYLSSSTDFVRIYGGQSGETMIPVTLRDGSGASISSTGGALNVNLVGSSGITATVTINPLVGISQADPTKPLTVQGTTASYPVRVHGLGTNNAVPVTFEGSNSVAISGPVTVDQTEVLGRLDTVITNTALTSTLNTTATNIYNKINSGDGVNTRPVKPGQVYYGHLTVAGTGTKVSFPTSTALYSGLTIKAATSNGARDVIVSGNNGGTSQDDGYPLSAGQTIFIETNNLQNISFQNWNTGTTLKIHYIAS